jgi:biotin synthesis protein BioG
MILDFKFQPHKSDSQLETCNSPKVNSMRREWITKEGSRILTLFFCGWGMDERAVQHVKGKGDLLLFYDYRDISGESRGTRVCVSWLGRWGCGRHRCC